MGHILELGSKSQPFSGVELLAKPENGQSSPVVSAAYNSNEQKIVRLKKELSIQVIALGVGIALAIVIPALAIILGRWNAPAVKAITGIFLVATASFLWSVRENRKELDCLLRTQSALKEMVLSKRESSMCSRG